LSCHDVTVDDQHESRPALLGDVLYANNTQVLASEYTWVGIVQSIAARDQLALHALYTRMHGIVFTWTMQFASDWKTAEERRSTCSTMRGEER